VSSGGHIPGTGAPRDVIKLAKIINAMTMIGMVVCPDDGIDIADPASSSCSRRSGPVSTRMRVPPCSTRIDTPPTPVLRLGGIAIAPVVSDPRHSGGRPAAEDDHLHPFTPPC
jgi:hypothetical protein